MDLRTFIERKLNECQTDDPVRGPAWRWLQEHIISVVKDDSATTESLHVEAANWLEWARPRKDLKIVTADVPVGILPSGTSGCLHDVKVFTRHGPDDALYDSNQDLRERVARGNCFIKLTERGGGSSVICVIHALKKFTGGLGDDDDRTSGSEFVWQRYFMQPFDSAEYVICTKKQNGEAAHLSAYRIGCELYICAGSKNVHLVFRNHDDLDMYPLHESRYQFAKEISRCILTMLDRLSECARRYLLEFLCHTRTTAVFELLNPGHQHVEDLSDLEEPQLKFIAWTTCRLESDDPASLTPFCGLPPDSGIELARIFELNTTDYSTISVPSLDEHMTEIRMKHGVEGEVLFFLDAERKTIGMLKKKTVWYIVCRAIREKIRAVCTNYTKNQTAFDSNSHLLKIKKRLNEIKKWLQLSDKSVALWKHLAEKFLAFCVEKLRANRLTTNDFSDHFPVHWKSFLSETGETDDISCVYEDCASLTSC